MASKFIILIAAAVCLGAASAERIIPKERIIPSVIPDSKIRLDVSQEECYDLVRLATAGDRLGMVKLLVDQGCSVNRPIGSKSKEPTPLHIAVVNDSLEMVKLLLDYNADMEARAHMSKELDDKKMATCKYMLKSGKA